jgi:DNA-directed RNA polymerase specialized sigma24 family protein
MSLDDSVTEWINNLKNGDRNEAQRRLCDRYFVPLVGMLRRRIGCVPRAAADEEDVVLSIFNAAFRGIDAGNFPKLDDRNDLWQIVLMLAGRKTRDFRRRALAEKRGGGRVRHASDLARGRDREPGGPGGLSQIEGREQTPDEEVATREWLEQLFALLPDDSFRAVAREYLAGHKQREIAETLDLSLRSVERKLQLILRRWRAAADT